MPATSQACLQPAKHAHVVSECVTDLKTPQHDLCGMPYRTASILCNTHTWHVHFGVPKMSTFYTLNYLSYSPCNKLNN